MAHTLSEHFIDHQFGNMSDSDVSEFECETPSSTATIINSNSCIATTGDGPIETDVIENRLGDYKNSYNLNEHSNNYAINLNNNYYNYNNNSKGTTKAANIRHSTNPFINNNNNENLNKVEDMLRCAFESVATVLPKSEQEQQQQPQSKLNPIEHDIENNLTTTLNQDFGIADDFDIGNDTEIKRTYIKSCTGIYAVDKVDASQANTDVIQQQQPPDILLKSGIVEHGESHGREIDGKFVDKCEGEEKPDILKNVSRSMVHLDLDDENDECAVASGGSDGSCGNKNGNADEQFDGDKLNSEKDDQTPWGITPVDIVGNFEQEVEREFGLLVSGYKNNGIFEDGGIADSTNESSNDVTKLNLEEEENFNRNFLKKVCDNLFIDVI